MQKTKKRGNGQGTAYKRGNVWEAQVILGWRTPDDATKKPIPIKRRKSGFATKKDAINYCNTLLHLDKNVQSVSLSNLYSKWEKSYAHRVSSKTLDGYRQAYQHFDELHPVNVDVITAIDLQKCMDNCKEGKRTHEMMKTTANLLWKYAVDAGYASKNVAANLYTGKGKKESREPITEKELEIIRSAVGTEPYADYVYALCYLGFRPTEFLSLKKSDFHEEDGIKYLIGGMKTDAGIDRRVIIPSQIEDIIKNRMSVVGTDLLFPMLCYTRHLKKPAEFTGYKQMTHNYFNNFVFKPLMTRLGVSGRVPYSARHTYANKLKRASGDVRDKASLIGHTDYDFTQHVYQSSPLEDLKAVVDTIV